MVAKLAYSIIFVHEIYPRNFPDRQALVKISKGDKVVKPRNYDHDKTKLNSATSLLRRPTVDMQPSAACGGCGCVGRAKRQPISISVATSECAQPQADQLCT